MRVRSISHKQATLECEHGELPLEFEPNDEDDILLHREGDTLVIAYLVHDSDASSNPLTDCDGQGDLYTDGTAYRGGVITDNPGELRSALCVSGGRWSDPEPELDREFPCEPYIDRRGYQQKTTTFWDLAAAMVLEKLGREPDKVAEYVLAVYPESEVVSRVDTFWDSKQMVADLTNEVFDGDGMFSEQVEAHAREIFRLRWRDIVGPFVVPMNYQYYGNDTSIYPTDWDGDHEDLPNCVWVADKLAEENIRSLPLPDHAELKQVDPHPDKEAVYAAFENGVELMRGTFGEAVEFMKARHPTTPETLAATARRYAAAVCDEYAKWCSGEVFGCVQQTFDLKPDTSDEWVPRSDEACWGFIGEENAKENLASEFFNPAVKAIQKEQTDAQTTR